MDFARLMQETTAAPTSLAPPEWTTRSRCLNRSDLTDDAMLPPGRERDRARRTLAGLCADCPVQALCLTAGIVNDGWGVWGGMVLERGKVRRRAGDVGRRPRAARTIAA